jgi:hypothetical protein
LRAILSRLVARPRKASAWPQFAEAVRAGAAYLAQGSSYAYLRARAGTWAPKLFSEDAFSAELDRCKWEGFAVAAQDLVLVLETETRAHLGGDRTGLAAALEALYADALALEPLPPHRAASGWEDEKAAFGARAAAAVAAPPQSADAISGATAARLLREMPVEDVIRDLDRPMVTNNVAFRFIDYQRKMRREIDMAALAAALAERSRS